jgi:NhaA family Na+:H+ antiporter
MSTAGHRLKTRLEIFVSDFIQNQQASGFMIVGMAILSMVLANSPWNHQTEHLLHLPLGIQLGDKLFAASVTHVVNDLLMAFFFLMVGLEIKKEFISGQLNSLQAALLPVACALGGMMMPALIYLYFNAGKSTASGWGIPMATDIAFALAVMSFLGNRIPAYIKVFLVSLAVADDLGAIVVIAFFYTQQLHSEMLIGALAICGVLAILNYLRVRWIFLYFIAGLFLWYFIYRSGIHATLSGVILSLFIPYEEREALNPSTELAHDLQGVVNFMILPLFAFCNTFIIFHPQNIQLTNALSAGIFAGLLLGKTIGIFGTAWLLKKWRMISMPIGISPLHLLGTSLLGGIGFTMSIFIALLSFKDIHLIEQAKWAIVISSLCAATAGLLILLVASHNGRHQ